MPDTSRRTSIPDPLAFLAALPTRRRNTILAFVNALHTDELEDLAIFFKIRRPETTDDEIAAICGVSRSKVARWLRYQALKPSLSDYKHIRHRPSKWRTSRGDRWPLDRPDGN